MIRQIAKKFQHSGLRVFGTLERTQNTRIVASRGVSDQLPVTAGSGVIKMTPMVQACISGQRSTSLSLRRQRRLLSRALPASLDSIP